MKNNNILKNIVSLYGFTIAKLVFPLITLPYLMRVLSLDAYGVVSYVKTIISYIQIIIDFAFVVSGTKDIVLAKNDINKINKETSVIMFSRLLLSCCALLFLIILIFVLPLLHNYRVYTLLSFFTPLLSIFLFDYVFRGVEKMEVITIRFFIMKSITTLLTFVFVKNDSTVIYIPILDIISSLIAVALAFYELNKLNIHPFAFFPSFSECISKLKNSFTYFASNVANIAFNSINTLLIGFLLSARDIAYWGICIQIVNSIQNMYNPIIDGLYPEMIKTKNFSHIKRALSFIMPLILIGCVFTFFVSKKALVIIGGLKYEDASLCLNALIPVMFFGFPSMLFGWTTLGSIGKEKQVTFSLILSAIFQLFFIVVLIFTNNYTLLNISILRSVTEIVLCLSRLFYILKYKALFSDVSYEQ